MSSSVVQLILLILLIGQTVTGTATTIDLANPIGPTPHLPKVEKANPKSDAIQSIMEEYTKVMEDYSVKATAHKDHTHQIVDVAVDVEIVSKKQKRDKERLKEGVKIKREVIRSKIKTYAMALYKELENEIQPNTTELKTGDQILAAKTTTLQTQIKLFDDNKLILIDLHEKKKMIATRMLRHLKRPEAKTAEAEAAAAAGGKTTTSKHRRLDKSTRELLKNAIHNLRDESLAPDNLKLSRNIPVLDAYQTVSNQPSIVISEKEANKFINSKKRTLGSRRVASRKLTGFLKSPFELAEEVVELGAAGLRAAENALEATAAALRETAREAQEVIDAGIRFAKEAATALVNKAIDFARDVASGAMEALKFAADGLLGMAMEAYNFLGKLEDAFSGGMAAFVKNVLNNLSNFPSMMIQWVSLLCTLFVCIVFKRSNFSTKTLTTPFSFFFFLNIFFRPKTWV